MDKLNMTDIQIEVDRNGYNYFISKFKELSVFFKTYFWRLLTVSIFGSIVGFCLALYSSPIYVAKMRFLIKESGSGSALLNSLGSLGSLIGSAGGSVSTLDRTIAIIGSEKIVGSALLKQIIVDGKKDLAINHFIKIQLLDKKWKDDSLLKGVRFFSNSVNVDSFSLAQRTAFKNIVELFIKERSKFIVRTYDKKSGILSLTIMSRNENLSIQLCKSIFSELDEFLYLQSISTSGNNIKILQSKIDSIKFELSSVQSLLARNNDRTLGLIMQEDMVFQKKLLMKEQLLTLMYGEAQKNLETFKFINQSFNTGVEVIEIPYSPIYPEKQNALTSSVIGFLIAGFLSFNFFYFKRKLTS